MPINAKVRSLQVRPIQSADLAFSVPGILNEQDMALAKLGARVQAFSLSNLYGQLGQTVAGQPERIRFDDIAIRAELAGNAFFAIRNEGIRANLVEGLAERESVYLERFARKPQILKAFRDVYPTTTTPDSRLGRLQSMIMASQTLFTDLNKAYQDNHRDTVVTETVTESSGNADSTLTTTTNGTSKTTGTGDGKSGSTSDADTTFSSSATTGSDSKGSSTTTTTLLAMRTESVAPAEPNNHLVVVKQNTNLPGGIPNEPATFKSAQEHHAEDQITKPYHFDGTSLTWVPTAVAQLDTQIVAGGSHTDAKTDTTGGSKTHTVGNVTSHTDTVEDSSSHSDSDSKGRVDSRSSAHTLLDEFRHPSVENSLRFQRTQANLQDEILSHTLVSERVQSLDRILDNQLIMLDMRLRQLQVAFLATFLVSPITGFVTGLYKDLGESVLAGEPVLRVENHDIILLVGRVQARGLVRLQDPVALTVGNVFEDGTPLPMTGRVVSVRGHDADNDEWDLIIECDNRTASGGTKLPINYTFDYTDVTKFVIG